MISTTVQSPRLLPFAQALLLCFPCPLYLFLPLPSSDATSHPTSLNSTSHPTYRPFSYPPSCLLLLTCFSGHVVFNAWNVSRLLAARLTNHVLCNLRQVSFICIDSHGTGLCNEICVQYPVPDILTNNHSICTCSTKEWARKHLILSLGHYLLVHSLFGEDALAFRQGFLHSCTSSLYLMCS